MVSTSRAPAVPYSPLPTVEPYSPRASTDSPSQRTSSDSSLPLPSTYSPPPPPPRPRLWVILLAAAVLVTVWTLRIIDYHLVDIPALFYDPYPNGHAIYGEDEFVREATKVEFPSPIDYQPIQEYCARDPNHFRPGLLFSCVGQHGGIGMVRNQLLKCVRYAMHAGGALVVPTIGLRSAGALAEIIGGEEEPLDYLLDGKAFVSHLSKGCPALRIYEHAEDFPFYEQRAQEPLTLVGDQFEPNHPYEGLKLISSWRASFDQWLAQQNVKIQVEAPVHIKMDQSYLEYPVRSDGDAFADEFGKIISFREDTRALSAKILWELDQRFELSLDPTKAINPGAFYGAHLRLEEDAVWAWSPDKWRFSRMEDQFEEQFLNLERTGLRLVYVASGNQTVVDLFAEYLNRRIQTNATAVELGNYTVVTKQDLLQGGDRSRLDSFTFDQLALVDFLVMFKSSAFMGVAHSSFSWNVALRRHELSLYAGLANEGSDLLRDEYSVIMGMEADYPQVDPFMHAIWP